MSISNTLSFFLASRKFRLKNVSLNLLNALTRFLYISSRREASAVLVLSDPERLDGYTESSNEPGEAQFSDEGEHGDDGRNFGLIAVGGCVCCEHMV